MRILFLILTILPQLCFADCFVVGDLKGYSARKADGLAITQDALTSQKFIVEIEGDNSSVSSGGLDCRQVSAHMLVCGSQSSKVQSVIEVWSLYPSSNKVVLTKANNGYGQFDGGNLFVGNIKGRCD